MRGTLLRLATLLSILLVTSFAVSLVSQPAQPVGSADAFHLRAADALLWSLVAFFGSCLFVRAAPRVARRTAEGGACARKRRQLSARWRAPIDMAKGTDGS